MTNLNKSREEIIFELVLSLNNGNVCYVNDRVRLAINQYNDLVENKIITEWCEHDWKPEEVQYNHLNNAIEEKYVCSKCGKEEMRVIGRP